MASESQAKNWLLIITGSMAVVFGYTTFYFKDQVNKLEQTTEQAGKNAMNYRTERGAIDARYREIVAGMIGETDDDHSKVIEAAKTVLGKPKIGETRKDRKKQYLHFLDALDFVEEELREADLRRQRLEVQAEDIKGELEAAKQRYDQQIDEARKLH